MIFVNAADVVNKKVDSTLLKMNMRTNHQCLSNGRVGRVTVVMLLRLVQWTMRPQIWLSKDGVYDGDGAVVLGAAVHLHSLP